MCQGSHGEVCRVASLSDDQTQMVALLPPAGK
jgi:hypothetical protein